MIFTLRCGLPTVLPALRVVGAMTCMRCLVTDGRERVGAGPLVVAPAAIRGDDARVSFASAGTHSKAIATASRFMSKYEIALGGGVRRRFTDRLGRIVLLQLLLAA